MTFENADIAAVLRTLSELWGKTIAIHPDLSGTMTVLAAKDVTVPESFEIMKSALNVRGYTMVGNLDDASKVIEVWPRKDMMGRGTKVQVGREPAEVDANIQIITQVVPLKFIRARVVADTLQGLISKDNANLVAFEDTNTLIITDRAENVKRLLEVIRAIDETPQDRRQLEVVSLQNGNAEDIQRLLVSIYSDPMGALARQVRGRGSDPQAQQQILMMLQAGAIDATSGVRITADTRTNSLVLYGPPETLESLRTVVQQLDRNVAQQVIFRKFKLQYGDAATISQNLNLLFQQPQGAAQQPSFFRRGQPPVDNGKAGFTQLKENLVVADSRTNSILVTATPDNMRIFEDLIRSLDQPGEISQAVEVVPLEFGTARTIQTALQQLLRGSTSQQGFFFFLFGGQQQSNDAPLQRFKDVTVVANADTNSLIITGPPEALPAVRRIIDSLDQPQAQVYISVIIADVTLSDDENLGFELNWKSAPGSSGNASTSFATDTTIPQGIRYALVSDQFNGLMKALSNRSKVKVLSTPHITTLDNTQATISIGTQYPFPQSNESVGGTVTTSFNFKDISIQLQVTPRVSLGSQMVTLAVNQTIDELTGTVNQGGSTVPIIATRNANTKVMVQTGQTVVIGGVIRDRLEKTSSGVPILQDLPLVGDLFKRKLDSKQRTELLVFMTPFVITTDGQMQRIKEQRQKELSAEFPQANDYLDKQLTYGEPTPPKPDKKPADPQPKPRPEPVPQTYGPERPRTTSYGPPLPHHAYGPTAPATARRDKPLAPAQ